MIKFRFHLQRASRFAVLASVAAPLILGGCLETRAGKKEVEEKQVLRKQVATLQQTTADVNSRFVDLEDQSRHLNGRLESLELKLQQATNRMDNSSNNVDAKLKEKDDAYREEFAKLSGMIEQLRSEIATLQSAQEEERKRASAQAQAEAAAQAKRASKGPFELAEEKFEQKNWKEAILDYEKYRKANTKGKQFPTATYKIGVAFQELGMNEEARAFYEEVVTKFPKSKESEKALGRLKKMKK